MGTDCYKNATEIDTLPSLPGIAARVLEVVSESTPDLVQLQRLIESDPVLVLRVLRAANSGERTTQRPISTVLQAIRTLGVQEIQSVLLGFELPSWTQRSEDRFDTALHWRHSLTTAMAARDLVGGEPTLRDEAYAAGILQDIGVLALREADPIRYDAVLRRLGSGEELWLLERHELGTDHMDVGAGLLQNWRIPAVLWEPIAAHDHAYASGSSDSVEIRMASVLRVAAQIGKVLCYSEDASALLKLREMATSLLGIDSRELDDILGRVEPQIRDAAARFDLDVGEPGQLLQRANARLAKLSLVMGHNLAQVEHRLESTDRAARELRVQRFAAEEANRLKSQFLANMSHEIRTPMTAIVGYLDLMVDPNQSAEERSECVSVARRNSQHLLKLIDDILDISKLETGHVQVERIPTSVAEVVNDIASLMRARAVAKGLGFVVDYTTPIPETIASDPHRLRQILLNLVGNAIKFTERGEVRISVSLPPCADPEPAKVRFEISDTGIGIAPDAQRRVFDPFVQADMTTTREFGGTGLGLAISKRMAGLLGGDIELDSTPGEGARISVSVDAGRLEGVAMIESPGEVLRDLDDPGNQVQFNLRGRVLLAEDGDDNRRLITLFLKRAGLDVETAVNGRIALDKALSAAEADAPYDVILMDVQMPEMDGLTATSRLRQEGYTGCIIALTAHALVHERERCFRAGCDEFASKPIDRKVLLTLVEKHLLP